MLTTIANRTKGDVQEEHTLDIPECCPVSHNPREGSKLIIKYQPLGKSLEIASLLTYIHSFKGGLRNRSGEIEVRDMEDMIQRIQQDCETLLEVPVIVQADLQLLPRQEMKLIVSG